MIDLKPVVYNMALDGNEAFPGDKRGTKTLIVKDSTTPNQMDNLLALWVRYSYESWTALKKNADQQLQRLPLQNCSTLQH